MSRFHELFKGLPSNTLTPDKVWGPGWVVGAPNTIRMQSWRRKAIQMDHGVIHLFGRKGDKPGCASVRVTDRHYDILWYSQKPSEVEKAKFDLAWDADALLPQTPGQIGHFLLKMEMEEEFLKEQD